MYVHTGQEAVVCHYEDGNSSAEPWFGGSKMGNTKLGRKITLDELFDLALFKKLHELELRETQVVLSRLIVTE